MTAIRFCIVAMTCASLTSTAFAQSASPKELYDNGQLHYESGQFDLAIEAWTEAHRMSGRPILLIKLADAHEALGNQYEAIEFLESYIQSADPSEIEPVSARIERLRSQIMQAQPGPDSTDTADDPAPETPPSGTDGSSDPAPSTPDQTGNRLVHHLTLGTVSVTGLGVGTGFGLAALSHRRTALESCVTASNGALCTNGASESLQQDKSASTVADIGFIVGGGALLTWTIAELLHKKGPVNTQVSITHQGAALRWTIR